jgi:type VI secretion system secreted protein Hcp
MAFDTFLEFPKPALGAPGQITAVGESGDAAHKGSVQVSSFAFGVENPTIIGSATGGAGTGKAKFSTLQVTKGIDSASPGLFSALSTGAHFPEAVLHIRKAGAGPSADYLVYRFSMVFVTKVDWAAASGDDAPQETVELMYGAMQVSYAQQMATGQLGQPRLATWNQVTNTPEYSVPAN